MRIKVIRIGKSSEPGAKQHRQQLKEVLILNNKHQIKSILITKLLEYDPHIAKLLKVHDSTLHYSLGNPTQETGAVKFYGATNSWRVNQAKQYLAEGVNVWVRPTEDPALAMPEYLINCLNTFPKERVLLTPLRYRKKVLFPGDWDAVKQKSSRYYYDTQEKAIVAAQVHKDWADYHNICGKINDKLYCNACGLKNIQT